MSYGEHLLGLLIGMFGWFATPDAAIMGIWVLVVLGFLAVGVLAAYATDEGWRLWWLVWLFFLGYVVFMWTFLPWVSAAIDPTNYGALT